jgi:hypothetical protein
MAIGTIIRTLWVCQCCLFAREGDGDGCDGNGGCAGDPWRLLTEAGPGYSVTAGMLREEHECPEDADECDCETRSFSWSPCDGCGSPLGGARYAYAFWLD